LAIADKTLLYIESFEDLLEIKISAEQDKINFIFKDSVLNLPILRKYIKAKGIIKEPMPKYAFL
jgi:hypothetical protein